MATDRLTTKQQVFVAEYLKSFNATQAAITAGYSEASARFIGAENLTKPNIARAIKDYLDKYAMSAGEVLYHLTEIARGDIGDVISTSGAFDYEIAADNGKTRLVKSIKRRTITTEQSEILEDELEMYDRLKALDLLAKYHDLTNRVKVDDWRSEAVRLIQRNEVTFEALVDEFGNDLATSLFAQAGVPVGHVSPVAAGESQE